MIDNLTSNHFIRSASPTTSIPLTTSRPNSNTTTTTSSTTSTSGYDVLPCLDEYALKVGNGLCDDVSNMDSCNYDGGDCCGDTVRYGECQDCRCLQEANATKFVKFSSQELPHCPATLLSWVGDGECDDVTNMGDCFYDGGDCCANTTTTAIKVGACIECQCLELEVPLKFFLYFFLSYPANLLALFFLFCGLLS